jgi:hypothetical protein
MTKRNLRYKDTVVAPGSELYQALEKRDKKLAEKLYQKCEQEARDLLKWQPVKRI